MAIPFTQYLRPDGRKTEVFIDRPSEIEAYASRFIGEGGRFECEVLTTGEISFTAVRDVNGEPQDVAIEICDNGPAVRAAVDALVMATAQPR